MYDVLSFVNPTGIIMTPAAIGTEVPGNITRRAVVLSGNSYVRAMFSESLGNVLIGCGIEYRLNANNAFTPLVPVFYSGGIANELVLSDWNFIPGQELNIELPDSAQILVKIYGDGILPPIIRYCSIQFR